MMIFEKIKFLVKYLPIAAFGIVSLYFVTGKVIFGSHSNDNQPIWLFVVLAILSVLSFVFAVFFYYKKYDYRPCKPLIIFFSFVALYETIVLLCFKNGQTYSNVIYDGSTVSFSYSLTAYDYASNILRFLVICLIGFFIFDMMPKIGKKEIIVLSIVVFASVALVSIIYSLFSETEKLSYLFSFDSFENMHLYALTSFYPSKNAFAIILFGTLIGLLYLHNEYGKYPLIICLIPVLFFMVLTISKLIIFVSLLVLLFYFVYRFIITLKIHRKMNIITMSIVIGVFVVSMALAFSIPTLRRIVEEISNNLFQTHFGVDTFEAREKIWSNSFNIISHFNIVTGVGYGAYNNIIYILNKTDIGYFAIFETMNAHNTYVELIAWGGVILLLMWASLMTYIIYIMIRLFKINIKVVVFESILLFALIVISVFESGPLFFVTNSDYAYLTAMLVIPLIAEKNKISPNLLRF